MGMLASFWDSLDQGKGSHRGAENRHWSWSLGEAITDYGLITGNLQYNGLLGTQPMSDAVSLDADPDW